MVFRFRDLSIDISRVDVCFGLDASLWAGVVTISRGDVSATANWKGDEGSNDGRLFDVEGVDESFCEELDGTIDDLSDEISARLDDPCSPEERRDLARHAEWFDEGAERAGRRAA